MNVFRKIKEKPNHLLFFKFFPNFPLIFPNFFMIFDAMEIVDNFTVAFETVFDPHKNVRFQGSIDPINCMPSEIIELESRKIWMINVYKCKSLIALLKVRLRTI